MGLFISDNGAGKTVAAASFPGPIKFYDFDGRMAPVKLFYPNRTDIEYITVGKDSTGPDTIGIMEFSREFESLQDRCDYATIVIDSFTALTSSLVQFMLGIKGTGKGAKILPGGISVPTWDEFNGETSLVAQILDVCKILPCNVIMTAHPVDKSVDMGGTLKKARSIAAYGTKTPSLVPIYFNEIYTFGVEPGTNPGDPPQRFCITQPTGKDVGKTALPLPSRIDITNKPLYKVIQGYLEQHHLKIQEGLAKKSSASGPIL